MKKRFYQCVGAGLLGVGLSLVAFTPEAAAQVDAPTRVVTDNDDDDFDWGWLGLLGLLGLGGLMRRDPHHTTHRATVGPVDTHTTRT
jgi:MYXO-CTERM domain-containing protein